MSDTVRGDLTFLPPLAARLAQAAARPRAVAALCVILLTALGWLALGILAGSHASLLSAICGPVAPTFDAAAITLLLAMWGAMVLAMMVPSASATLLTYAEIADTAARKRIAVVSPLVLTSGYLAVWLGFALGATALQIALGRLGLLDPASGSLGIRLSGLLFIVAGLYQFSALKHACLRQCRNPFPFFFTNWTTTLRGVFRLGVKQGLFCLGCCWAAMLVMLALGVMNVVWMAVLAVAMTVEKLVNMSRVSHGLGVILLAIGLLMIGGAGID